MAIKTGSKNKTNTHDPGIKTVSVVKNTWILEVPEDVCKTEGFAKGTLVCLTLKDNGIQAQYIRPPSKKLRQAAKAVLERNLEAYAELRKIDD